MSRLALMGTSMYWTSPFQVGSHHIARELVRQGYQVAYLSDPVSPFRFLKSWTRAAWERYTLYQQHGEWYWKNKLWAYVPGALLPPSNRRFLRSTWLHRNWWRFTHPFVTSVLERRGFREVDLLYLDNPRQHFLMKQTNAQKVIYRMADFNAGFRQCSPGEAKLEEEICQRADLVIYPSKSLADRFTDANPKQSLVLPNGVNFDHFQADRPLPEEYKSISGPIAVYVGAIDYWFDFDLMARTANEMSELSFVIIGPDEKIPTRLSQLPNVHVLGTRPYESIPGYLQHADVGLIPFTVPEDCPDLVQCINPLKLYEYMACGLPVVSTEWDEIRSLNSPAHLCSSPEEFVLRLKAVLSSPEEKTRLRAYASTKSWQNRVSSLLQILNSSSIHESLDFGYRKAG
mgnify:CR=1 FL=1